MLLSSAFAGTDQKIELELWRAVKGSIELSDVGRHSISMLTMTHCDSHPIL